MPINHVGTLLEQAMAAVLKPFHPLNQGSNLAICVHTWRSHLGMLMNVAGFWHVGFWCVGFWHASFPQAARDLFAMGTRMARGF